MTYKNKYYNIDTTITTVESDKTLFFNFKRILSSDLQRFDFEIDNNIIGLGYRINNNDDSNKNVRFDGVEYILKSFIITSRFDGNSEYGIIIELESSQTKKMYIQIPLEIDETGNVEDIRGELDVLIAKADEEYDEFPDGGTEPEKNPTTLGELFINEWFLNVNTFNHYNMVNDIYVYIESPTIKVRKFTMELISAGTAGRFGNTPALLNRQSFPLNIDLQQSSLIKQFDIGDIGFEDIYIDCSPEDYDENNRIINPKKVYTVKPLFGSEQYGKISGELSTILFAVIVFALIFLLFNYNISMPTNSVISRRNFNVKTSLKYLITIGIILIGVFTILFIGKATDGLKEKFIFNMSLLAILAIISAIVIFCLFIYFLLLNNHNKDTLSNNRNENTLSKLINIIVYIYNYDISPDNKGLRPVIYFIKVFSIITILLLSTFGFLSIVGIKFKASVYLLSCLFFTVIIFGIKILNIEPTQHKATNSINS